MRELDLLDQLNIYAGTSAGVLVVVFAVGGVFLLVRYLFRRGHLRRAREL